MNKEKAIELLNEMLENCNSVSKEYADPKAEDKGKAIAFILKELDLKDVEYNVLEETSRQFEEQQEREIYGLKQIIKRTKDIIELCRVKPNKLEGLENGLLMSKEEVDKLLEALCEEV